MEKEFIKPKCQHWKENTMKINRYLSSVKVLDPHSGGGPALEENNTVKTVFKSIIDAWKHKEENKKDVPKDRTLEGIAEEVIAIKPSHKDLCNLAQLFAKVMVDLQPHENSCDFIPAQACPPFRNELTKSEIRQAIIIVWLDKLAQAGGYPLSNPRSFDSIKLYQSLHRVLSFISGSK